MKHSLRYGFYLGMALIISYIFYYLVDPISMFRTFSKATIWEFILLVGFVFFAISKNKNSVSDSGTAFKIALITITLGLFISSLFRQAFSTMLADELDSTYLEASKADGYSEGNLFGSDPLETLERVELMEHTLHEDFNLFNYLSGALALLFVFCLPFSAIISFFCRQILRYRKT